MKKNRQTTDAKPALQSSMEAENPAPQTLPTLSVRKWEPGYPQHDSIAAMVGATFPNVPGFRCDSWCYESELDYIGVRPGRRPFADGAPLARAPAHPGSHHRAP